MRKKIDYLAKKREYVYHQLNKIYYVHTFLNEKTKHQIWMEGKNKSYRDTAKLVVQAIDNINTKFIPDIVIVDQNKFKALSAYDRKKDAIFVSNGLSSKQIINKHLITGYFASKNLTDILNHEIGHRLHQKAANRYYVANKSRYNNFSEAKKYFDSKLYEEINILIETDSSLFKKTFSDYALMSFVNYHEVNDVIAEYYVRKHLPKQLKYIEDIIKGMLNYGL